jgi:hypothetical protein
MLLQSSLLDLELGSALSHAKVMRVDLVDKKVIPDAEVQQPKTWLYGARTSARWSSVSSRIHVRELVVKPLQ